jgi:hypothetical protein
MSIEQNLDRIASALEVLAAATLRDSPQFVMVSDTEGEVAEQPAKPKTYAEQRKAEVKAEAAAPVVADKPKRGRPPKNVEPPVEAKVEEPVVEASEETDPFAETAEEPEVEEITPEVLRKTMVDCRKHLMATLGDQKGKDKAYAILREHGNGASVLPGSTAAGADATGVLKPEFYAAVVKAARKAMA